METSPITAPDFVASDTLFRDAIIPGKFVRIEYLTDLNEFIKADVTIKQLVQQDGTEWLELATGDKIALDRVVSISGNLSPRYPGYGNYSCDC
ncbi:hypothetical protein [Spirosoma agri]|jgi:hypothetical protein|uniref:Uncharacterized protein n=1 Tax=Spirosoma agri TaxID=1987381 RepID=A0A6M0ISP2_9BACT|nr:hypothetical protein [Spirosoma agri]NEU70541.1 hypothetical protein [Spirosoma agri]